MLFDLRSRGRRNVIKVVYLTLALLMGGGLVFFGIGSDVAGGIVDAITERDGQGGGDIDDRLVKREADQVAATRANPQNATAWAELARTRYLLAGQGDNFDQAQGTFTEEGRVKLRQAAEAWQKHLELAGERPDDRVASLMVQAFGPTGLNDLDQAVLAQEAITQARPTSATFAQLAVLAYQADQSRKGDLASERAVELAPEDRKKSLEQQLEQAKTQALTEALQQQSGG